MTSFSLGTLVAALAPAFPVLVAGPRRPGRRHRADDAAADHHDPQRSSTPDRRGRMMGTISIVISVAPAIGPTVSGLVLDQLSWRWMFWIVLPIALVSLALGARVGAQRDRAAPTSPIDVVSVVLSALAFGGLIYGLSSIGESATRPHARARLGPARRRRRSRWSRSSPASSSSATGRCSTCVPSARRAFSIAVRPGRGQHDGAVRHPDPAADLPAERARPLHARHRPPAAARRSDHGPARPARRSARSTASARARSSLPGPRSPASPCGA